MTPSPSVGEIQAQMAWEVAGTQKAITLVREAVAASRREMVGGHGAGGRNIAELPAGQRILFRTVPALIAAIEECLRGPEAALDVKRPRTWAWVLSQLEPEQLAVITVITALRSEGDEGSASLPLAKSVASAVRDQLSYNAWAGDGANKAALKRLQRRYPDVDRRTWKAWAQKVKAPVEPQWPQAYSVAVGAQLLGLLLQACPDYFTEETVKTFTSGLKTQAVIRLTEEARLAMADAESRAQMSRPGLLPMICPPTPWTRKDTH